MRLNLQFFACNGCSTTCGNGCQGCQTCAGSCKAIVLAVPQPVYRIATTRVHLGAMAAWGTAKASARIPVILHAVIRARAIVQTSVLAHVKILQITNKNQIPRRWGNECNYDAQGIFEEIRIFVSGIVFFWKTSSDGCTSGYHRQFRRCGQWRFYWQRAAGYEWPLSFVA